MITQQRLPKSSERSLALLWRRAATLADGLVTRDGQRLRVLYPGRPSARAGPDFLDAVLVAGSGELLRGDVELHLSSNQWRRHGHHRDQNYNGVVLHVVLWSRGQATSALRSGVQVPVAALGAFLTHLQEGGTFVEDPLSSLRSLSDEGLGHALDRAGDERFLAKSRGFMLELGYQEGEEVVYQGLMEALGYASNRRPFRELAGRVPLRMLRPLVREPSSVRLPAITALLVDTAGLLPYVKPQHRALELESLLPYLPERKPMTTSRWCLFRVRPQNHPLRRLLGAAHLVERYLESGLVAGLLSLAQQRGPKALTRGLMVQGLIGKDRAGDMAVNVALPFLYAWSQASGNPSLGRTVLQTYYRLPRLARNEIIREMERLLFPGGRSRVVDSTRRQQGLIHLYKSHYVRLEGTKPLNQAHNT